MTFDSDHCQQLDMSRQARFATRTCACRALDKDAHFARNTINIDNYNSITLKAPGYSDKQVYTTANADFNTPSGNSKNNMSDCRTRYFTCTKHIYKDGCRSGLIQTYREVAVASGRLYKDVRSRESGVPLVSGHRVDRVQTYLYSYLGHVGQHYGDGYSTDKLQTCILGECSNRVQNKTKNGISSSCRSSVQDSRVDVCSGNFQGWREDRLSHHIQNHGGDSGTDILQDNSEDRRNTRVQNIRGDSRTPCVQNNGKDRRNTCVQTIRGDSHSAILQHNREESRTPILHNDKGDNCTTRVQNNKGDSLTNCVQNIRVVSRITSVQNNRGDHSTTCVQNSKGDSRITSVKNNRGDRSTTCVQNSKGDSRITSVQNNRGDRSTTCVQNSKGDSRITSVQNDGGDSSTTCVQNSSADNHCVQNNGADDRLTSVQNNKRGSCTDHTAINTTINCACSWIDSCTSNVQGSRGCSAVIEHIHARKCTSSVQHNNEENSKIRRKSESVEQSTNVFHRSRSTHTHNSTAINYTHTHNSSAINYTHTHNSSAINYTHTHKSRAVNYKSIVEMNTPETCESNIIGNLSSVNNNKAERCPSIQHKYGTRNHNTAPYQGNIDTSTSCIPNHDSKNSLADTEPFISNHGRNIALDCKATNNKRPTPRVEDDTRSASSCRTDKKTNRMYSYATRKSPITSPCYRCPQEKSSSGPLAINNSFNSETAPDRNSTHAACGNYADQPTALIIDTVTASPRGNCSTLMSLGFPESALTKCKPQICSQNTVREQPCPCQDYNPLPTRHLGNLMQSLSNVRIAEMQNSHQRTKFRDIWPTETKNKTWPNCLRVGQGHSDVSKLTTSHEKSHCRTNKNTTSKTSTTPSSHSQSATPSVTQKKQSTTGSTNSGLFKRKDTLSKISRSTIRNRRNVLTLPRIPKESPSVAGLETARETCSCPIIQINSQPADRSSQGFVLSVEDVDASNPDTTTIMTSSGRREGFLAVPGLVVGFEGRPNVSGQ